jgi:hypothetical protein
MFIEAVYRSLTILLLMVEQAEASWWNPAPRTVR